MIHLSDSDRKILQKIFSQYPQIKFLAFGSRVSGKHRQYSDLDLAYENASDAEISKIVDELEESHLTIKVDLVDLKTASPDFKKLILTEAVPF